MGARQIPITTVGPAAEFAEYLRRLREDARLTLRELAKRSGLAFSTLSVAQSGQGLPSWDVARKFIAGCGADPEQIRDRWLEAERLRGLHHTLQTATNTTAASPLYGFSVRYREPTAEAVQTLALPAFAAEQLPQLVRIAQQAISGRFSHSVYTEREADLIITDAIHKAAASRGGSGAEIAAIEKAIRAHLVMSHREASPVETLRIRARGLNGPPPLPVAAATSAQFIDCLRMVKFWTGASLRDLAAAAKIPRSTLYGPIRENRTSLPRQDAVLTFLAACGVTDDNAIREWLFTWRRLKAAEFEGRRKQAKNNLIVLPKKAI